MEIPIVCMKVKATDYQGHVDRGNSVFTGLNGNTNFPTPNPTLAVLTANIGSVEEAITAWGTKGNRGAHEDLIDLRNKTVVLRQTLKSLRDYCQSTAQVTCGTDFITMRGILSGCGFPLKDSGSPIGVLSAVQDFHVVVSEELAPNQVKLAWRKPANCRSGENVTYKIIRGIPPAVLSTGGPLGLSSKSSFLDVNNSGGTQTWCYWVVPFNGVDGAPSEAITVTVPSN